MRQSHEAELDLYLDIGLQFEALESVILLDIPKDRLRLYRMIISVIIVEKQ